MFTMYDLDKDEMQVELDFNKQESEPWWTFQPLTYLDLSSNVIQAMPANIKIFEELSVLNVRDLDEAFAVLIPVCLQLQHNSLTSLPAEIGLLRKLTKLNASHNNIKTLPSEIYKLTELQVLILSHNHIESITVDVADLVMLHHLVIKEVSYINYYLRI